MTDPKLESAHHVADKLGVSVRTLLVWSQAGTFPRLYLIGRRWRVNPDAVARWLEQQPGDPERDRQRADWRLADVRTP